MSKPVTAMTLLFMGAFASWLPGVTAILACPKLI
jgi:hypothetical protein